MKWLHGITKELGSGKRSGGFLVHIQRLLPSPSYHLLSGSLVLIFIILLVLSSYVSSGGSGG